MKPQELRIGNKIWRPCCYDEVLEIRENGIIGLDSLRGLIPYSEIEPIPITDELLEKNGFELTDKPIVKTDLRLQPHFVYRKTIDNVHIDVDPVQVFVFQRGTMNVVNIQDLKHLHQLQNAYYLATGEELEIKL